MTKKQANKDGEYFVEQGSVELSALLACPWNMRTVDDAGDPSIAELATSIAANGLIAPITVRRKEGGFYEVIAGSRRVAACRQLGFELIPAIVRDLDDAAAQVLTVTENMQRADLSPLEEAIGVKTLLDQPGWDLEQVAAQLGKSAKWVARRAQLTKLSERWLDEMANAGSAFRAWPVGHFETIAKVGHATQDAILDRYLCQPWHVASATRLVLEQQINEYAHALGAAPWKKDDATLVPEAGACSTCPKRASQEPLLFDLEGSQADIKKDRCLDVACWEAKEKAYVARRARELGEKYGSQLVLQCRYEDPDYPNAVSPRQYCKQSDPGAEPTLVVNGDEAGKLYWTKPSTWAKPAKPKGKDGKPVPKPLDEKRQELLARRQALAISYFQDELKETEVELGGLTSGVALRLAAIFGTERVGSRAGVLDTDKKWIAKQFDRLADTDPMEAYKELWRLVKQPIKEWLTCGLAPSTNREAFAHYWARVEWLAPLIGLEAKDSMARAERELPEPKTWAQERSTTARNERRSRGSERSAERRSKASGSGLQASGKKKPKKATADRKTAAAGRE